MYLLQGRLFVWAIRDYDDIEPIVFSVDEEDEISIGDVANLVLVKTDGLTLSACITGLDKILFLFLVGLHTCYTGLENKKDFIETRPKVTTQKIVAVKSDFQGIEGQSITLGAFRFAFMYKLRTYPNKTE